MRHSNASGFQGKAGSRRWNRSPQPGDHEASSRGYPEQLINNSEAHQALGRLSSGLFLASGRHHSGQLKPKKGNQWSRTSWSAWPWEDSCHTSWTALAEPWLMPVPSSEPRALHATTRSILSAPCHVGPAIISWETSKAQFIGGLHWPGKCASESVFLTLCLQFRFQGECDWMGSSWGCVT